MQVVTLEKNQFIISVDVSDMVNNNAPHGKVTVSDPHTDHDGESMLAFIVARKLVEFGHLYLAEQTKAKKP